MMDIKSHNQFSNLPEGGKFSKRSFRRLIFKLVISITIVAIVISPLGLDRPKPAEAIAPIVAAAVWCLVGMGGAAIGHVLYRSFVDHVPWEVSVHDPWFVPELIVGCVLGPVSHHMAVGAVGAGVLAAMMGFTVDISWGVIASKIAEDYFPNTVDELTQIVANNFNSEDDYTLSNISSTITGELSNSSTLENEMTVYYNDYNNAYFDETGTYPGEFPELGSINVELSPASGTIYQLDLVELKVLNPISDSTCTDTDIGTVSDIKYVEFGYAFTPDPVGIQPLPSTNIAEADGKDWYGCNGWALDFDVIGASITSPTNIYLAARVLDGEDNLSPWVFSGQLIADPRSQHDYELSNIQYSTSSPNIGETVQASATVTNVGVTNEGNVRVRFYRDGNFQNSYFIAPLNAGESLVASFNWVAEGGAHTLMLEAALDGDKDPANDTISGNIIVGTAPLLWVNGSSSPPSFPITSTTQGSIGSFNVLVQNAGSASTDVTVSKGGTQASWITLGPNPGSMGSNTNFNFQFSVDVPPGQSTGSDSAEIYFDWTDGSTVTLPVQFDIVEYQNGFASHTFSPSTGNVNGDWQSTKSFSRTNVTLDNDPGTLDEIQLADSFDLLESEYYRIEANSIDEWHVNVTENFSESSQAGAFFDIGSFSQTETNSYTGGFDIFGELIIGQNNWLIGLTNLSTNGANTEWVVNQSLFTIGLINSAWWSPYNIPASTLNEWKAGWIEGRVCANVDSVSRAGDVILYVNGVKARTVAIDGSDTGDEVCWSVNESRVDETNTFNFKADLNGAQVTLSNIHWEIEYYTGKPALQAERNLSLNRANVNENVITTLDFANVGSNFAEDTTFNDSLPAGLQLVSGSLSGTTVDMAPGGSTSENYTFKGTTPGTFVIPGSLVTYYDPSGFGYITLFNTSVVETWGGTLQPVLVDLTEIGEAGISVDIVATATESLGGTPVEEAQIIADITLPDMSATQIALIWDGGASQYVGTYIPTQSGDFQITANASKPFYDPGTSPAIDWQVQLPNQAPIANAHYAPMGGGDPLEITLNGSTTIDVDGVIIEYAWDVDDDGLTDATGRILDWTFPSEGDYPVTLRVTDNKGATDDYTFNVAVGEVTVDIPIQMGWNLISLPVNPLITYNAEGLCTELSGIITEIDRWYAGGWDSHICGLPFNDFDIEIGQGYFVKSDTTSLWSISGTAVTGTFVLNFTTGWNLVSIPYGVIYNAGQLGTEINGQGGFCDEIDRWYAGGWDSHIIGLPFNDFSIEPGTGYFIKCTSSSVFSIAMP